MTKRWGVSPMLVYYSWDELWVILLGVLRGIWNTNWHFTGDMIGDITVTMGIFFMIRYWWEYSNGNGILPVSSSVAEKSAMEVGGLLGKKYRNKSGGGIDVPKFGGFVSHHQTKYLMEMIFPIIGWCETLGHRNQALFKWWMFNC